MMILAIVTGDPAQLGAFGGDLIALLASSYFTPLAAERFGEAKLAVLLRVAATMISWTILW